MDRQEKYSNNSEAKYFPEKLSQYRGGGGGGGGGGADALDSCVA